MINRSLLATAGLLLALIPGAGTWLLYNTAVDLQPGADHEPMIEIPAGKKPFYGAVKKHMDPAPDLEPNPHSNKQHKASADPTDRAPVTQVNENHAEKSLYEQTPAQLWQYWRRLLNQSEFQQLPIIGALLAERLRKQPDPEVYQNISDFLAKPNVSMEIKAILLDLLAEIATPDALRQLLSLAEQGTNSPLYIQVLQALSRIGDNRWDGRFHTELSQALETAWSNPDNIDQAFLSAVGKAIAAVGSPEGVNQLLLTVSGNNKDKATEETNRIKQAVAFEVIPEVRNPDAVDVLSTWFEQEPLGTPAFEVSGSALAEIGSPKATQEIVDWAQQAPAEGARNLEDWLSKIDDADSLGAISSAQDLEIQNPEIENVIDATAANIDSTALSTTSVGDQIGDEMLPPLPNKK